MNTHSFFSRLHHFPIPNHDGVILVALIALVWGGLAFCDEIHDAARDGDLAKVMALLKDNPNLVFSKDGTGLTPLHEAASQGHEDMAQYLLFNKAEVNARDDTGNTPLHMATYLGHKDVVELLLPTGRM